MRSALRFGVRCARLAGLTCADNREVEGRGGEDPGGADLGADAAAVRSRRLSWRPSGRSRSAPLLVPKLPVIALGTAIGVAVNRLARLGAREARAADGRRRPAEASARRRRAEHRSRADRARGTTMAPHSQASAAGRPTASPRARERRQEQRGDECCRDADQPGKRNEAQVVATDRFGGPCAPRQASAGWRGCHAAESC